MLKLTEAQADQIRDIRIDLEEAGFKNIIIKLHPTHEKIGSKQEPLSWQFWPRLRASITFDVPFPLEDKPSPPPSPPPAPLPEKET